MAVTKLDIHSDTPFAGGQSFESTGSYRLLTGIAHFSADPKQPENQPINDIELAPRNEGGQVEFSASFQLLMPESPEQGNRRLLLDVPNRGRPRAMKVFNSAPEAAGGVGEDPGNGFLMRQGYTVVWCGWQHDVPSQPDLLGITVPAAVGADGEPISEQVTVTFQTSTQNQVQFLSDRNHQAYAADTLEDQKAVLTVQEHEDAPLRVISRSQWSFCRLEGERPVPDSRHIYMASGFLPGKVYRVTYQTSGPPVIGLGLLATRDLASFLKYADRAEGNPCGGSLERAYAFGQSQSGRFLRLLLYLGLNLDESGRDVFDGMIPHVGGGRRGEFNHRFGQPSSLANYSPNNLFPFAATEENDPVTRRTDGLLTRLQSVNRVPKVMLTNTPTEYWGGHCSLIHTDVQAQRDLQPSDSVRIYLFSGTQHASGNWPLTDRGDGDARGQHPFNWVDYRPLLRAALVNLDQWVTSGAEPPESRHPRLADGTLVSPEGLKETFLSIPGAGFPDPLRRIHRLDFGPNESRPSQIPPLVGEAYPNRVPQVDEDGNENSGIRLPAISVPVATNVGWNLRHRQMGGAGQTLGNNGSTLPFAATKAQREAEGDPRLSLEERYSSREDYLRQVGSAAEDLVAQGYMLQDDINGVLEDAARQYDWVMNRAGVPQPAGD